jgi:hypothetical protein
MAYCFAFAALLCSANVACAQKLIKAEIWTRTGDDNKDKDTGVYVYVKTNDLATELANIENADNSSKDATEYNDWSEHTIKLVVQAPGVAFDKCRKFKFRIGSKATGKDKWIINKAKVTLYFDDGTNLVQECGEQTLYSKDSKYVETDWLGGQ